MCENVKALIAKAWKDEDLDLEPGRYELDEVLTVRVSGSVEKQADQLVAPTTSIPLVPTLALFWEKCGVTRDKALAMLRVAITEAMNEKADKGEHIEARMKDVDAAIKAVKEELIAKLPKVSRSGRLVTKNLQVEVVPAFEAEVLSAA